MKENLYSKDNIFEITNDYYDNHATKFINETIDVDMSSLYEPFISLLPEKATILDAGCGSGRDSKHFLNKGYDVIAFDSSLELIKLASDYLNIEVLHLSFEEITFVNQFDGIWACASLLHVSKSKMNMVLKKLEEALKQNGILYASFKYGDKEEFKNGRFFNYYNEETFNDLIQCHGNLKVVKMWKTKDIREDRQDEYWLNVLLKRINHA